MSEHTKGRWEVHGATVIWSPEEQSVIGIVGEPRGSDFVRYVPLKLDSPDFKEACANAARIVECVNAYESLRSQRDALAEALALILGKNDSWRINMTDSQQQSVRKALAARVQPAKEE